MKKIILILAIALTGIIYAQNVNPPVATINSDGSITTISSDQDGNLTTNTIPAFPPIHVTQTTNVNVYTFVDPLILEESQMAMIIAMVQSKGISASFPITTTNIQEINVRKERNSSKFVISFQLAQ